MTNHSTQTPVDILISGAKGRMGQALIAAMNDFAEFKNLRLAGALEHAEHADLGQKIGNTKLVSSLKEAFGKSKRACLIEFTTPKATLIHVDECLKLGLPIVIGTTGLSEKELEKIQAAAKKIPVVMAANFSVGVTLMLKVVQELAGRLPGYDLEIVEAHHKHKKDAPSGTALRLAQALADGRKVNLKDVLCTERSGQIGARPEGQIGIQTLRGGDIVGDHTVMFAGPGEQLKVSHNAQSRMNFAAGALKAANFLWATTDGTKPGRIYDMFDVLKLESIKFGGNKS